MPGEDILNRYGHQPHDPSPFTRRCRMLQSWYRVEVLCESDCGPWRAGAEAVGSSLVKGNVTAANFISPAAFRYAKEKVEEKRRSGSALTIDEHRLFNNMLSSQPMCFNLFSDLRLGVEAGWPSATRVLAAMFRESEMVAVSSVEVESIPTPVGDYIDDKTAFDALICFTGADGNPALAAIETKYTDELGGNLASRQERKAALAERLSLFTREGSDWYANKGYDQLARNLLLTLALAEKRGITNAINYVVGPREDDSTPRSIAALRARLQPPYQSRMVWLPLEELVERGMAAAGEYERDHLARFRRRYLDFEQVAHLMR